MDGAQFSQATMLVVAATVQAGWATPFISPERQTNRPPVPP